MNQTRQKHLAVAVAHQSENLEGALEASIAATEARKADEARWAKAQQIAKRKKRIESCQADVRAANSALADAYGDLFDLLEEGRNPFKEEFGHDVPGEKSK